MWLPTLVSMLGALACGGPRVDARAIWVDGQAGEDLRRVHVYDRGELELLEVRGHTDPREHVRLGPHGRGVLVRAGERRGVWFDLDDQRRLPLLLPSATIGADELGFDGRGEALWWLDRDTRGLSVLPLAPGLPLAREPEADGGALLALTDPEPLAWVVASADAPILFTRQADGGASFVRHPVAREDALALVRLAEFPAQGPTLAPYQARSCSSALECYTTVGVDADGELAIVAVARLGPYLAYDRGARQVSELELPEALAEAAGLGLLAVFDRSVSAWISAGQLFRWDRARGQVDSLPLYLAPPLHWSPAEQGRALALVSTSGPLLRLDRTRLEVVSLETTACVGTSGPVFAPDGRWAAWTCRETSGDPASSSVIVRVSSAGIDRHVGIAMEVLSIDDDGELLLYSVESSFTDLVDGVAQSSRPRTLFVLSSTGVLTRVDELEPAPTPVELGDIAVYLQAAALP